MYMQVCKVSAGVQEVQKRVSCLQKLQLTGGSEPCGMGVGSWAQISLQKQRALLTLSHLFSPYIINKGGKHTIKAFSKF